VKIVFCCLLALLPNLSAAQGLDPQKLLQKEPIDTWPTYNGDYSGRRFSPLTQIQTLNVRHLSLAWMYRVKIAGGAMRGVGEPDIKSTPLMVDGVLYFTIPDHVYALDGRTGAELWHYDWVDKGGHLIGNRGVGMYRNWLYFLAPDGWLISLDAATGKERWRKKVADEKMQYFTTGAPMVVGNHVIMGVGGDAIDVPGYLESHDPESGELQWRWNSEPAKGEPGSETWPNENAMSHGGGMTWLPGTYDPELNLLYWGTGNANPVMAGQGRAGSNLWTCSIVALNADTGKLVWYFQGSPHDTHDWDNTETPVLFDAEVDGKPRKLLAQAARNGYFFVLDRTNGANLVSKPFVDLNWSKGIDAKGQPIPDPQREDSGWQSADHQRRWWHQLDASQLQPANRSVLRQRDPWLQRDLPHGYQRQSGRIWRIDSRPLVATRSGSAGLEDRGGEVEPSLYNSRPGGRRLRWCGNPDDCRRPSFHR
jgi:acido-empty-quinoprotein group A